MTEGMEGLDRACKELYKNKEVLAIILKGVAREFENYSYREIGRSWISLRRTPPPRWRMCRRGIAAQKTYRPGYPIEKRGIYYLARELSAQLSMVTENTDYGCLEKCYSIWICRDDVPQEERFSISFIELSNTLNHGKCHPQREDYDLLTLVVIRLGDTEFRELEEEGVPTERNNMMEFLHAIMYPHTKGFLTTVKKYIDFSENEELWREGDNMIGLGMSIAKESWEEGRKSGLEEGRKEVAFRMFSKDQTPEMVSDIIERPMEYTMELHRQYVEMVHEKGNYTTE